MKNEYIMTAEAVSEGHPDKLADQISDAILDEYLKIDPQARVACECLLSGNLAVVAGEVSALMAEKLPFSDIVRQVFLDVGYDRESLGFGIDDIQIVERIHTQEREISNAVLHCDGSLGAGDQGIMIGYATDDTSELMPMPVSLAKNLICKLSGFRHNSTLPWLRPDAKCQVTMKYQRYKPVAVETIVLSTQHSPEISLSQLRKVISEAIIEPVLKENGFYDLPKPLINPGGSFTHGGPGSDTGLTGRKIVVDAYGPFCPVGGGAFSGKDATKVDRSGAYMARYIAKNIVAAGFARRCTIQLVYAIGQINPLSFSIDLHSTGKVEESHLQKAISNIFDLTPDGIINSLKLRDPVYKKTASCGHFGGNNYTWEKIDISNRLKSCFYIEKSDFPN